MDEVMDFLRPRGEYVSLFAVALVLVLAVRPVAGVLDLARERVGDLFWYGGLAFVVVGRLAYLAVEAPGSLLDPLVLVRVQGGVLPLAGAAAALAVTAAFARRDRDGGDRGDDGDGGDGGDGSRRGAWLAAGALGLAVATVAYDLACPLRDACYGAPAPAPLGFRMSGLADTRVATPLVEAAALLLVLAAWLRALPRLAPGAAALGLLAALALVRVALTPLSAQGRDAADAGTAVLVAAALALLAAAAWLHSRPGGYIRSLR